MSVAANQTVISGILHSDTGYSRDREFDPLEILLVMAVIFALIVMRIADKEPK